MSCQMMRVISSPSISTTVPATLILSIVTILVASPVSAYSIGERCGKDTLWSHAQPKLQLSLKF
jgi:hypothetical protein